VQLTLLTQCALDTVDNLCSSHCWHS